ncbi:MAG: uracil-DNA glycosylase [Micavibrio sp.]
MTKAEFIAHYTALQWHIDLGLDEILADEPGLQMKAVATAPLPLAEAEETRVTYKTVPVTTSVAEAVNDIPAAPVTTTLQTPSLQGTPALRAEAIALAQAANDLPTLKEAVANFSGNPLRKTATHLVFGEGSPSAPIMLVGEAPSADDDKSGRIFSGAEGALLDKILMATKMSRVETEGLCPIYLAHLVCWRPPGNRTPSPQEYELSLPFLERQIELIQPRMLIFCGGNVAKFMLGTQESLSKLRNRWHSYTPNSVGRESPTAAPPIPALVTYGPANLLNTPAQKQAAWSDWLMAVEKARELALFP